MDIKTIQAEFGKECECENDVIMQCIIKTKEMQNALKILGVDISKCYDLNYIYTYFLLKLIAPSENSLGAFYRLFYSCKH